MTTPETKASDTVRLEPCPACGGEAIVESPSPRHHAVRCKEARCLMTHMWPTRDLAIETWNTRPSLQGEEVERISEAILCADTSNPVWRGLLNDSILAVLSTKAPAQGDVERLKYERLKTLLVAADLPNVEVEEDYRPGMSGNRHIVYDDGDNRLCFMAHSDGRHPERDKARAYLIAETLNALPQMLAALASMSPTLSPKDEKALTAAKYYECPTCKGRGEARGPERGMPHFTCKHCFGSGVVDENDQPYPQAVIDATVAAMAPSRPSPTSEVVERIKQLLAKATPGPWTIRTLENFGFNVVHYNGGDKFDIARVAKCGDEVNAQLIVEAVNALPALLESLSTGEGEKGQGDVAWNFNLTAAPKDGETLWLLVDYSGEAADHPLADATIAATLGSYLEIDGDEGEWQFAGWCWSHDHFTDGRGKVLAWKPIGFDLDQSHIALSTPLSDKTA